MRRIPKYSSDLVWPSRNDVQTLKVGDFAPDAYGQMSEVVSIFAQRDDINGHAFVCYYTKMESGSTCSMSIKENEIVRTVRTSQNYLSSVLDRIERTANAILKADAGGRP